MKNKLALVAFNHDELSLMMSATLAASVAVITEEPEVTAKLQALLNQKLIPAHNKICDGHLEVIVDGGENE